MNGVKIDIFKLHKAEYKAGKKPTQVATTSGLYLSIEGKGAPGSEPFQTAIAALYGMAYTVKMGRKADGKGDYTIGKLEAHYWVTDGADLATTAMENWSWQLLIRTPEVVDGFPITDADLETARARLRAKKKDEGADLVSLVSLEGGSGVQMLHVGPYETEHETLALMLEYCAAENLKPCGRHHEIYLSDPRRVAPENLKTILRMLVAAP